MRVLGHALSDKAGAVPARQLLKELHDVANVPANFSGLKHRRRPDTALEKIGADSPRKWAPTSVASLAWSPAVISVRFRAWDVVCGVTEVSAWIAWIVRAFLKAVLLDGWKPTGADSQGQPHPMLCVNCLRAPS